MRAGDFSKVVRRLEGFEWEGVPLAGYKKSTDSWQEVTRRVLVGEGGESADFQVRYFEIGGGGFTTFEKHRHVHVVVGMRGCGEVQLGSRVERIGVGDVVYVAPHDPHQFRNPEGEEPFGFLCVVPTDRDRPEPIGDSGFCPVCE